jgi:hypothetical protein
VSARLERVADVVLATVIGVALAATMFWGQSVV